MFLLIVDEPMVNSIGCGQNTWFYLSG